MDFAGDFETHFTLQLSRLDQVEALKAWGAARGMKCVHIVLSSGASASQPMLTRHGQGVLAGELEVAAQIGHTLEEAGFVLTRIKVEAAPWNEGIPRSPEEAQEQPPERYFEHHVKLLLDAKEHSFDVYIRQSMLSACAAKHGARLSQNVRRKREDGRTERFVTQRCHGVHQAEAQRQLRDLMDEIESLASPLSDLQAQYRERLRPLVDDLQPFEFEVLDFEEEFVVYDSNLALDAGWFESQEFTIPNTHGPAQDAEKNARPQVFEPALKHFGRAFRLGDPSFADEKAQSAWSDTRLQIVDHLLRLVSASPWSEQLVLRGSLLLRTWLGQAAREPGDIDWMFRSRNREEGGLLSQDLFSELRRLGERNPRVEEAEIVVDKIAVDDIWTYERIPGRRIVFPWRAPGLPPGEVQMDVVFGEELFTEPTQVLVPALSSTPHGGGVRVWAAGKEVSLAWKIEWLETDMYPQGKDLYDATLLAEHMLAEQIVLPLDLLHRVMESAAEWKPGTTLQPDFPLRWRVDWNNFKLEYPNVPGEAHAWQARLARALSPTFAPEL